MTKISISTIDKISSDRKMNSNQKEKNIESMKIMKKIR
jgi:hypothetical protein